MMASTISFLSAFSYSMALTQISPFSLLVTRSNRPPLVKSWTSYKTTSLPLGVEVTSLLLVSVWTAAQTSSSLYPLSQRQPARDLEARSRHSSKLAAYMLTRTSLDPDLNLMVRVAVPARGLHKRRWFLLAGRQFFQNWGVKSSNWECRDILVCRCSKGQSPSSTITGFRACEQPFQGLKVCRFLRKSWQMERMRLVHQSPHSFSIISTTRNSSSSLYPPYNCTKRARSNLRQRFSKRFFSFTSLKTKIALLISYSACFPLRRWPSRRRLSLKGTLNFSLLIHSSKVNTARQFISNLPCVSLSNPATRWQRPQKEVRKAAFQLTGRPLSLAQILPMNQVICPYTSLFLPNRNSSKMGRESFSNNYCSSASQMRDLYARTMAEQIVLWMLSRPYCPFFLTNTAFPNYDSFSSSDLHHPRYSTRLFFFHFSRAAASQCFLSNGSQWPRRQRSKNSSFSSNFPTNYSKATHSDWLPSLLEKTLSAVMAKAFVSEQSDFSRQSPRRFLKGRASSF